MALPDDVNYCYLAGQFIAAVIDSGDPDDEPDAVPFVGLNVKVRALPKDLPVTHRASDQEIVLADIDTFTNAQGRIHDGQGNPWIAFVAPSASLSPGSAAPGEPWKVTVTVSGPGFTQRSKTFVPLPSSAAEPLQWTDIIEVAPSTPAELEALQQVLAEVAAGRAGAEAARDDAIVVLEQVEGFAGTNNEQVAAMVTTDGPTKEAIGGIAVPYATGWSDATRALHARQSSRGSSEVNVLVFDADPTGVADSTAAINQAISTAKTFNVGSVFIPAGRYRIDGTVAITHEVMLRGQYMAYAPSNGARTPGTVLVAGTNASGAPVIEAKNPSAGGYLAGVAIRDLMVLGSAGWTSPAGAKDRVAIRLYKVISEFNISGVIITGFLRQGIDLVEAWDGTITNVRIMYCGTPGTYPALNLGSTPEGNTNSVHAFGVHIEHCPYILNITGDSRHNIFTGCKFELNSVAPTSSPITIGNSIENTFVGCYFVSRNTDDPIYATVTSQPHFISVTGSKAHVTFADCMGSVPGYTGTPLVDPEAGTTDQFYGGARWLNVTAGIVQWAGGILNAWGGQGATPFILSTRSTFKDATVFSSAKGGIRSLFTLADECQVVGNAFIPIDASKSPTAGVLFTCTGARNVIGPNVIRTPVFQFLSASVQQSIARSSGDEFTYSSGTSLNLGWVDRFATDRFVFSFVAATNVVQFTGGWVGREVTVRCSNSNVTLVNSANLILKGGVNVTPPANGLMRFLALSATVWAEVSRSF